MFKVDNNITCICLLMLAVQRKSTLSWRQRSKILKDICRGLSWLHGATPPIMHGDVKMYV